MLTVKTTAEKPKGNKGKVIHLLTPEEKEVLDLMAKIFVESILKQ